jgi:polyisoprenoid-binding protein YceI
VRYEINPVLSRFTLKVHATGMFSAFGHSPTIVARDFSGQVTLADDRSGTTAMELRTKAASLTVADDVKEADRLEIERLMRKDVLEVDRYPEITFTSTEVTGAAAGTGSFRVTIKGTLALHGVSHPQQLDAQVNVMGDRLTANGQSKVRQSDYGIKPVSIAGGTLKLKDEIDLSFDIVARAKPAA